MTRMFSALSLGLAACIALPATGEAQSGNCAPRDRVIAQLSERFGEARQSIGMAAGDRVVEMFASPDTGTWTITMTMPSGLTCIIGAGEAWERVDEAATPAGQPV